jgi:hypothetical protein
MNEIVRKKRSALVVDTRLTVPRRPILTLTANYHDRHELIAQVRKLAKRGQVRPLHAYPVFSPERGYWEMRVLQLKPPPPAWHRPALITAAAGAGIGTFFALGWWVLTTLAALPLMTLLGFAFIALVALLAAGRTGSVTIINNITNNVR